MKESITTVVIVGEEEKELTFEFYNNEIIMKIEDKEICRMDYVDNLLPLVQRMTEIWGRI